MSHGFSSIVQSLEDNDQLIRISDPVFPWHIQPFTEDQASSCNNGKALLFEKTNTFPSLTNVTGSDLRNSILLKVNLENSVKERIEAFKKRSLAISNSFVGKLRLMAMMNSAFKWFPKRVKTNVECHSFVKFKSSFSEVTGSDRIDSALIAIYSDVEKRSYLEPCAVKLINETTASIFFKSNSNISRFIAANNYRLPAALVLGGDIAYYFASAMKIPDFLDVYTVAGFLRNSNVRVAKCISQNVLVPDDSDIVIEGFIQKSDGLFHLSCVTHRKNAIYPESFSQNEIAELMKSAGISTGA